MIRDFISFIRSSLKVKSYLRVIQDIDLAYTFTYSLVFSISLLYCSCRQKNEPSHGYFYIQPQYNLTELVTTTDSVKFALDDTTYNDIESFNTFIEKGTEYISFYDQGSESINVYHLQSQKPVKKILLKAALKGEKLFKTTVYFKGFDSIYVVNKDRLFLLDSSGSIRSIIDFLKKPRFAWAIFDNTMPPHFEGTKFYAGVRPSIDEVSADALKAWRVMYRFDLQSNNATLYHGLPKLYHDDIYGDRYLKYGYCYNNRGKFVFSFAADTVVYETDINGNSNAYFARSEFQKKDIQPVTRETIKIDEGTKSYYTQDSYGAVYFDPFAKRYLRVFNGRLGEQEFQGKVRKKKQRVLILNESFKIIGESPINDEISLSELFFTSNGKMFVRCNTKVESAIQFVQLTYNDKPLDSFKLANNEK